MATRVAEPASVGTSDVKSARRVLDILELLGSNVDGLTFAEIARRLDVAKSSLHALLTTMVRSGWINLENSTRNYRIGSRAWEAGQGYQLARELVLAADPHLRSLCHEVNETVQLGILDGVEVLYIAKVESDHPFRLRSRAGSRFPAWASGLGKVLLASLPPEELRSRMADVIFEPFTEKTVRSLEELEEVLERIRREGVGRDEGELNLEVHCVAAPVLDQTGKVIAAVSCSAPESIALDPARDAETIERLKAHTAELSQSLGWRPLRATIGR
jgi:IclR family KDG regulon transcriptional repressor